MSASDEPSARPYRIKNTATQQDIPHKCYKHPERALNGALLEVHWTRVMVALEVYNKHGDRWVGTYRRKPNGIIEFQHRKVNGHG